MEPKIIIHGGFFSESSANQDMKEAKQKALSEIVSKSHKYLQDHSAVEAAVYAVTLLEDCDLFNAGIGSQLQADGKIRMSASVMDGASQCFSGVVNIQDIKNPILVAEKLLDYQDHVLSGTEALDFARKQGFSYFNPETPSRREEYEKRLKQSEGKGTVGCVALDKAGRLAAATSTGGKGFEMPGRVGDSATVAGNFATNIAAISCTGISEDIVNNALAAKIITRVSDGMSLEDANKKSFAELKVFGGLAGAISITAQGEVYHIDSEPYMVWAAFDGELKVFE